MARTNDSDRVLIVIPAYNEGSRLHTDSFKKSLQALGSVDYLFVNDGSTDSTKQILDKLCREDPCMSLINLESNQGKAEAVRQGFLVGFEKKYQYIGYWDADLATPLPAIKELMAEFKRNDTYTIVIGSRVKLLGRLIERKILRHYLGRIFATCVSVILQLSVYDTQCGAKIFKNTDPLRNVFSTPFSSKWIFDVEILARLKTAGVNLETAIFEFPLWEWRDICGSKLKIRDFLKAVIELATIYKFLQAKKWQPPLK